MDFAALYSSFRPEPKAWRASAGKERCAILIMLAGLAGCAVAPHPGSGGESPIDTTIAAVRADGPKYDDKYVRVRGLVVRCSYFPCELVPVSPDGKPDWKAKSLRFDFAYSPALGIPDSVMRSRVNIAMGFLYRFSEVTLVGRYDYACDSAEDVVAKPGNAGKLQEVVVCTDGGPDLHDIAVGAVHRRWPSTAFSGGNEASKLISLSPETTRAMAAIYQASGGGIPVKDSDRESHAFVDSFEHGSAHFCVCLKKDCTGQWPTEGWHLRGNPMNPYTCASAKRTDGVWRFQPSFDQ
jgi:hypothetical protein